MRCVTVLTARGVINALVHVVFCVVNKTKETLVSQSNQQDGVLGNETAEQIS